jgi:hypothetical protein
MAEQLPNDQMLSLEELVVSYSYEMVALVTVLEKKGIMKREEIVEIIKELKAMEANKWQ